MNWALLIFLAIVAAIVIPIVLVGNSFYGPKQVTITPTSKFIDPPHYLVESKDQKFIELDRPWWNWQDNIDLLYQKVDGHIKNNESVTYECYAWDNQGLHWYYNCYKELAVNGTEIPRFGQK